MKKILIAAALIFSAAVMAHGLETLKKDTSKIPVDPGLRKQSGSTPSSALTTRVYPLTVGKNIPDNIQAGVTAGLRITNTAIAKGVSVCVDIDHTYRGDLIVKVKGPNGKENILWNKQGGSVDGIKDCSTTSSFTNFPVNGTWTVTVADVARQDTGKWNSVQIKIVY